MSAPRLFRAALALVALAALSLSPAMVHGDGAFVDIEKDTRGKVVSAVPRQHTSIAMKAESVVLVPFYDAAIDPKHPRVYVDVRYRFSNPGPAEVVHVGFPELGGKVTEESGSYGLGGVKAKCGDATDVALKCPPTIEAFVADDGQPLSVSTAAGSDGYVRWFLFDVPFPEKAEHSVRNRYVARLGYERTDTNVSAELEYDIDYVLHTGSSWNGSIGEGEVDVWEGGYQPLKHFTDLRPTKADDVHAKLAITERASFGRPELLWDYGNGQAGESASPRFEKTRTVLTSSARRAESPSDLPHVGAMVVDRDPTTAWIDAGPSGAIGEWVEIPVWRVGRVRAIVVRAGELSAGVSRVKRMRLGCFDLAGNLRQPVEVDNLSVELADQADAQRVLLPRPLADCHSLRFTIEALHGAATGHATLAEVDFVAP
jgi:hypothetical protein